MSTNDEAILAALLTAGSVRRAASVAGVSESTVRNKLSNPDFRAEYDSLRGSLLREAAASLMARLDAATLALGDIVESDEATSSVRVAACDALLRHGLRYVTAAEFERRLSALEAIQDEASRV